MRAPAYALALSCLLAAPAGAEPAKQTLKVGDLAPNFTLPAMNPKLSGQRTFPLRNFVGDSAKTKKTVVLSFAASYCEPCKKELPELKARAERFRKAGVELAVVVIDTEKDGIEQMRKLTVDTLALSFPVLSDRFGVLARRYEASALPKTVVIRPDGTIKWMSTGFEEGAIAALEKQLGL